MCLVVLIHPIPPTGELGDREKSQTTNQDSEILNRTVGELSEVNLCRSIPKRCSTFGNGVLQTFVLVRRVQLVSAGCALATNGKGPMNTELGTGVPIAQRQF